VLQGFPHSFDGSRLFVEGVRERLEFAGMGYEQGERSDMIVWVFVLCMR
jgi:hypothetical protein